MKSIKTIIFLLVLSLGQLSAFGQAEIFGRYKVACFLERNQNGSLAICSICPTKLDNNQLKISDFELEINNQFVKITIDGKSTNVTYTWNSKIDAITFEFEKSKYTFKVLKGSDSSQIMLKESNCDGMLMLNKI